MLGLSWLPVMPACALFCKITLNPNLPENVGIIHVDWIRTDVAWALLILNIPLWLAIYQYLDAIMPSEYGIAKHPCFCFMKAKKGRANDYSPVNN